jgi:hypothetical protein
VRITVLVLALFCAFALAADDLAAFPAITNRQSAIVDGTDAITIPQMLSYQGKLTDTFGLPVTDTFYAIRFRLYAQPTGGTQFWEENQNVRTTGGLFSTLLGSVTPIGTVPDAGAVYLGMAVAGGAELAPRQRIASAAYAYLTARAADSDLLQGRDTTTFSRSTHNHDATYVNEAQADAITSGMIVNGTIAATDLGQMGAASGQVMKWTGSAWAPRNDSVGGGGGTVTSVSQAAGIVCTPNPITTTGTVRFDSTCGCMARGASGSATRMPARLLLWQVKVTPRRPTTPRYRAGRTTPRQARTRMSTAAVRTARPGATRQSAAARRTTPPAGIPLLPAGRTTRLTGCSRP